MEIPIIMPAIAGDGFINLRKLEMRSPNIIEIIAATNIFLTISSSYNKK